nr:hypothetical protein [Tanacetum cinerariifolium]
MKVVGKWGIRVYRGWRENEQCEQYFERGVTETFNSQQSSPKLNAASAIKFLELNALKSQQSSPKLNAASAIKFLELNALKSQQSFPKLDDAFAIKFLG